jgi:hypothetical protein
LAPLSQRGLEPEVSHRLVVACLDDLLYPGVAKPGCLGDGSSADSFGPGAMDVRVPGGDHSFELRTQLARLASRGDEVSEELVDLVLSLSHSAHVLHST